jgi:hypothetical protein
VWPCYRLVIEKLATWTEVRYLMSIDDVDLMLKGAFAWDRFIHAEVPA